MKVILLSSKAQNGKNTCASILKELMEQDNKKVLITHYADLLKYICKTFFNWNGEKDNKGRSLLQYVGTDIIRKQRPEYWVDFIINILRLFQDEWDYVLIPDTRFPNEIDEIKSQFDTISMRIERIDFTNSLTEEQRNHESETALDNYDFDIILHTISDIDYLREKLKYLYDTELKENIYV